MADFVYWFDFCHSSRSLRSHFELSTGVVSFVHEWFSQWGDCLKQAG